MKEVIASVFGAALLASLNSFLKAIKAGKQPKEAAIDAAEAAIDSVEKK